jgi:tRNA 2-thiouridine synthesizing protein A
MSESDPRADGWAYASTFDGADRGCGDLLLALRRHFLALPPGTRVRITATNSAAPSEIAIWCRLAGHLLLDSEAPFYLVEKRS